MKYVSLRIGVSVGLADVTGMCGLSISNSVKCKLPLKEAKTKEKELIIITTFFLFVLFVCLIFMVPTLLITLNG